MKLSHEFWENIIDLFLDLGEESLFIQVRSKW